MASVAYVGLVSVTRCFPNLASDLGTESTTNDNDGFVAGERGEQAAKPGSRSSNIASGWSAADIAG
jgi:hypothetical protein